MSRSRRKTPIAGLFGSTESDKVFKRIWHRRMRVMMRNRLHDCDPDTVWPVHDREASDVRDWQSKKEGKYFFDAREYPQLMRK